MKAKILSFLVILVLLLSELSVFHFAVLPAYAVSETLTFATTVDDCSLRANDATYLTAWNAAAATLNSTASATMTIGQFLSAGQYYLLRTMLPFDTSSLPDSATVTSVILSFNITLASVSTANFTLNIYVPTLSVPSVTAAFSDYWYQNWATPNMTKVGDWGTGNWTGNNLYYNVTLSNSAVNVTGYSRICLRSSREEAKTPPAALQERLQVTANASGTVYVSQLYVTYTTIPICSSVSDSGVRVLGYDNTFSSYWTTDSGTLSHGIFSWNGTGAWVNDTAVALSGAASWFNVTKTLPTQGGTYGSRFYANDSGNSFGASEQYNFTTSYYNTSTLAVNGVSGSSEWYNAGVSPYLDTDNTSNYIYRSAKGKMSQNFTFTDLNVDNLYAELCLNVTAKVSNATADQIDVYCYGLGSTYPMTFTTTSWETKSFNITGNWNTTGVNALQVSFWSSQGNSGDDYYVEYAVCTVRTFTLINRMRFYLESSLLNWEEEGSNYFGLLFGQTSESDLETFIDDLATDSDWLGVLQWSAILKKLGIERETSIKYALGNLTAFNGLPASGGNGSVVNPYYYLVYDRDVLLSCYYYAEKYDYLTSKWNKTQAFAFFRDALAANLTGGKKATLYVYQDGSCYSYSDRFYDENAETVGCYLTWYDLGVTDALAEAEAVWSYINNNHWNATTSGYSYLTGGDMTWECEGSFFLRIISLLRYADTTVGNGSRLFDDVYARFLVSGWSSPQWSTYTVVHANPGNTERRLQNTLGAWSTLLGVYSMLNSTGQENLRGMVNSTWFSMYFPNSGLYNITSQLFRTVSGGADNSVSTVKKLVLDLLTAINPNSTSVAYPLEEMEYEYNYDIDPDLYGINVIGNTLKIPVASAGSMKFIFGGSEVYYSFDSGGLYNVTFNANWTAITEALKISGLPSDRKYLFVTPTEIGVDGTHTSGDIDVFRAKWSSSNGLSVALFYWNATGDMIYNGSSSLSGAEDWSNFSRTLPYVKIIAWYISANDTTGMRANTSIQFLALYQELSFEFTETFHLASELQQSQERHQGFTGTVHSSIVLSNWQEQSRFFSQTIVSSRTMQQLQEQGLTFASSIGLNHVFTHGAELAYLFNEAANHAAGIMQTQEQARLFTQTLASQATMLQLQERFLAFTGTVGANSLRTFGAELALLFDEMLQHATSMGQLQEQVRTFLESCEFASSFTHASEGVKEFLEAFSQSMNINDALDVGAEAVFQFSQTLLSSSILNQWQEQLYAFLININANSSSVYSVEGSLEFIESFLNSLVLGGGMANSAESVAAVTSAGVAFAVAGLAVALAIMAFGYVMTDNRRRRRD